MAADANRDRTSNSILIVDDDARIRTMLNRYLAAEGYGIAEASDGAGLRAILAQSMIDLVLLDLGLPGEDGFTLAREIRAAYGGVGVIIITGRDDVIDRVAGLEVGADDYIAKPFHLREVLARVRSVLRRRQAPPEAAEPSPVAGPVFRFAGWTIEPAKRRTVNPDGVEVSLTTGEFDLLLTFINHAGRVLERDQILDLVKGREWAAYDRSIDQQVARLRRKIEPDPGSPTLIKAVRGVGYLFTPEVRRG